MRAVVLTTLAALILALSTNASGPPSPSPTINVGLAGHRHAMQQHKKGLSPFGHRLPEIWSFVSGEVTIESPDVIGSYRYTDDPLAGIMTMPLSVGHTLYGRYRLDGDTLTLYLQLHTGRPPKAVPIGGTDSFVFRRIRSGLNEFIPPPKIKP